MLANGGGAMSILLHHSLGGFASGTKSASTASAVSAPLRAALFGTGISWSWNNVSLQSLKMSAQLSDPSEAATFSSGNTVLGPRMCT